MVSRNQCTVNHQHRRNTHTGIYCNQEKFRRIRMIHQIIHCQDRQDNIHRLDRHGAVVVDRGQEYDGNDACNQHIASAHDAAHAAALACMLLSQHDDAGYRADNAHAEQHPRYQYAGLPGVAVAQQTLEDHQHQHAEQAHAEYREHLVGGILFLRNWLFTHIVFCQCLTLPLFLLTCCRRHRARPQAPQSAQSHTAGCVCRVKRSAVPRPRLPLPQPDRSRPPARPSAKPCP